MVAVGYFRPQDHRCAKSHKAQIQEGWVDTERDLEVQTENGVTV